MPHIFRFHNGHNDNILDWKPSDRISAGDVRDVADRINVVSSSVGSSIPTPIARMFLFKTAFELMSGQIINDGNDGNDSIYAGLVSETLDLLELLYINGGNARTFRFEKWEFNPANTNFFGADQGHELLFESFKHAAVQYPFNGRLEITLIYYKEENTEILIGGTSPFTFVFTSPNFKRKLRSNDLKKVEGLTNNEFLFENNYKQLHQRDHSFIRYIEGLKNSPEIRRSFDSFVKYVDNTKRIYPRLFTAETVDLEDIHYGTDNTLSAGGINVQQISRSDYKQKIARYSDFKLDLPANSPYNANGYVMPPLFLNSNMDLQGQYTSPQNMWNQTIIKESLYPENTIADIQNRPLPGNGIPYPFLSKFDFFEKALVKLPEYALNDERFVTLIDKQDFILPIKPIFFQLIPLKEIKKYVNINRLPSRDGSEAEISVQINVPIIGPTMGPRTIPLKQIYKKNPSASEADKDKYPFIDYHGILGIFPFIKTSEQNLRYINQYTVASYEKTNDGDALKNIVFLRGGETDAVRAQFSQRMDYQELFTKTSYYRVNGSFDIIQLNFQNEYKQARAGLIIPQFNERSNGTSEYVYAIDFGTSNTHIAYGRVENKHAVDVKPFEIDEAKMVMTMLNKPAEIKEQDGAQRYNDYTSFGSIIDSAKLISLREFVPFQIGLQKQATTKFPFRTATLETHSFVTAIDPQVFADANIGFNIDRDLLIYNHGYHTNIKWELENDLHNPLKRNRVKIFFRELLMMIRSHALMLRLPPCDLDLLKIAMSFPISMSLDLKVLLLKFFTAEMNTIFGIAENDNNRIIEVTESIAPYYQLLRTDNGIQHSIFCNIDVGGGTSDVVLVNNDARERVLNCYCNSVRFAGRQLWGSVAHDFNPEENGFVSFFLRELQNRNPKDYDTLQKMINAQTYRTEDIISYLFSEERYGFNDIFVQCKYLKVPLLLHYTALLYFVAKSCKHKPIDLPRTLSFSGKGSEYLSLVFSNPQHLTRFTKRALSLFSGLPANPEFNIKRSDNPKVITAQGSVIFGARPLNMQENDIFGGDGQNLNGGEPIINPVLDKYYGLADKDTDNTHKNYGYFREGDPGYESVMQNCVDFLETFFGDADLIRGSELALGINNLFKYKDFFINPDKSVSVLKNGVLRNSYLSALAEKDYANEVTDSPFFFAFNTSLIELSKFIASEQLK